MKKLLTLLFLQAFVFSLSTTNAQNKALDKALQKEYKTKMKEFKKGGWEIFGSSRSLDVALLNHYDKLNKGGDNTYEIVGIASAFKSKNIGRQIVASSCQHALPRLQMDIVATMQRLLAMGGDICTQMTFIRRLVGRKAGVAIEPVGGIAHGDVGN